MVTVIRHFARPRPFVEMLISGVATLSLVCLALPLAIVSADKYDLNGWYPCSDNTFSDEGSSTGGIAECAVYRAPLCYPGICETPPSVDSTVDIFVKQLPATFEDPAIATNVWFVAGGPGYSSSSCTLCVDLTLPFHLLTSICGL